MANSTQCRYDKPLTSVRDVRVVAVRMHHEAFNHLGFSYKVMHGYYGGTPSKMVAATAVVAVAVGVGLAVRRAKK